MERIEQICQRIFSSKNFFNKFLVGGVLSFIPILNIFSLGYLYRYSLQVRQKGDFTLPKWKNWPGLFIDGLKFLLLAILFAGIPVLFGWALSSGLRVPFSYIRIELWAFIPFGISIALAPHFMIAALYRFQSREKIEDLLRLDIIFSMILGCWHSLIIPGLALIGLLFVGLPIIGFSFFLGFSLIIAYFNLIFLLFDSERKA